MIVQDAYERVIHNGIKETLTELRSKYWIIKGRQFVRRVIHKCIICRKLEGPPYALPPPPPLPDFRVIQQPPFMYTGVASSYQNSRFGHFKKGLDLSVHVLRHKGNSSGYCS